MDVVRRISKCQRSHGVVERFCHSTGVELIFPRQVCTEVVKVGNGLVVTHLVSLHCIVGWEFSRRNRADHCDSLQASGFSGSEQSYLGPDIRPPNEAERYDTKVVTHRLDVIELGRNAHLSCQRYRIRPSTISDVVQDHVELFKEGVQVVFQESRTGYHHRVPGPALGSPQSYAISSGDPAFSHGQSCLRINCGPPYLTLTPLPPPYRGVAPGPGELGHSPAPEFRNVQVPPTHTPDGLNHWVDSVGSSRIRKERRRYARGRHRKGRGGTPGKPCGTRRRCHRHHPWRR
jgi:hypothetical protein